MKKLVIWMLIAGFALSLAGCRASLRSDPTDVGGQGAQLEGTRETVGLPVEPDPVVTTPGETVGTLVPVDPVTTLPSEEILAPVEGKTSAVVRIENTAAGRDDLFFAQALEVIYEDEDNEYYFNCIMSPHIIVHYADGTQENVKAALAAGRITLEDLDNFGVGYMTRPKTGNGGVVR